MSVIRTECCQAFVDLDYHCDEIAWIDDEPWHFECAVYHDKLTEEQAESMESVFYTTMEK